MCDNLLPTILNISAAIYEEQYNIQRYLAHTLGTDFLSNILDKIHKRIDELDRKQLNEYLYHIYSGVEKATGLKLWLFDSGVCKEYFAPQLGGDMCYEWIIDLINSAGGCIKETAQEPELTLEDIAILNTVYISVNP